MESQSIFSLPRHEVALLNRDNCNELISCINDPIYFIRNHVKIQHPTHGMIPFMMTPNQVQVVRAYQTHDHVLATLPRQFGKTATGMAFVLWNAMFRSDRTIVMCSYKHDMAKEMLDRLRIAYEELPIYLKPRVTVNNKMEMRFDNGTRVITRAVTPCALRGYGFSLLYLDEFALVKPDLQEEFWYSAWPCMTTGSKCIIATTAHENDKICRGIAGNGAWYKIRRYQYR